MPKASIARKTPEQLKSAVWPDQKTALRELRTAGMAAAGEDYTLSEYRPGAWQLVPRDEADQVPLDLPDGGHVAPAEGVAQKPAKTASREQAVIDSLKRKKGAKPRGEPAVVLEARKPTAKANAKAQAQSPRSLEVTKTPKPPAAEKPGSHRTSPMGPPASVFADLQDEPSEPAKAINPLAPLPTDPSYEVVLRAADKAFPANSVVPFALGLSTRSKCVVHIRNGAGETVRSIDAAAIKALRKGVGRPAKSGAGVTGVGKSDRAAAMFMRPGGATFEDVVSQVTEWGISERFVNRLARARGCTVKKIAEKHYQLIVNPT